MQKNNSEMRVSLFIPNIFVEKVLELSIKNRLLSRQCFQKQLGCRMHHILVLDLMIQMKVYLVLLWCFAPWGPVDSLSPEISHCS